MHLDAVERVSAPCHFYIVRNERTLTHQLVRCDDKAADVPAHDRDDQVAGDGWNGGSQQPARARCKDRSNPGYDRADDQRHADYQRAV